LHLRALRRHTGLGGRSLTLELDRLSALGLVRRVERAGRVQFVADQEHPAWSPLWHLARYSIGAVETLGDALADVEGLAAAFVYGSIARGDPRPDSDVDLFVVGEAVNRSQLAHATMAAGSLLGREVNVTLYRPSELAEQAADGEGFVPAVLAGTKAWVVGDDAVLSALLADISPGPRRKRA
jgi:predicted nucleotidyltransferase